MNFLDNLVLPQSAEHLEILKYLLGIGLFVLIPYLSLLIGLTLLSSFFYKRGIKNNDINSINFAKSTIDIITFNKSIIWGLGFIPMLSVSLIVIQFLYLAPVQVELLFLISIILFFISAIFIYFYKQSLGIYTITSRIIGSENRKENLDYSTVSEYNLKSSKINKYYPIWGLISLLISSYFFIGGIKLASDNKLWNTESYNLNVLISINTTSSYFTFLFLSLVISYLVVLYLFYKGKFKLESVFTEYVLNYIKKRILISAILLLVFLTINLLSTAVSGLSEDYFLIHLINIGFITVILNRVYLMISENNTEHSYSSLYMVILVVVLFVASNVVALSTSTAKERNEIATEYVKYQDNFKNSLGIETVVISGEDIFNGKCIACHAYDKKIVGPPYNEVLVKYEGKLDKLTEFILNPVKVDPNYTSMPNQGVTPEEAKAVSEFLLSTYKK